MTTPPTETYVHGHHASVLRSHGWRTAENSAAYLLPHLRPDQRLLDVGTGPGSITVDFAHRLSAGSVTGIDNAAAAVEATRNLATREGVPVEATVGDVYALDFPNEHFDVVHAHQVLQHLADPVAALAGMRRVCRPGGMVAARDADYAAMTWFPASPGLDRWLELYRSLARAGGGEPDAGRRLRSWALAAGFAEVTSSASVWCFASAEDVAWWTRTWAERVTASTFAEQATALGLSDAEELAELARAWRAWGDQPDAWFSVLHGEVLARR
ncbi:class I SAM-dependent methyltransferase [uncultured Friedmanniella sp.]|uniref:class I SAM-dependent methyltransferase n=1 Tax=uncultured Friedmanniella sp. TaxID=335381 RepID=UPI0035C9FE98